MRKSFGIIIVTLIVTVGGIAAYHVFVGAELLSIIERIQIAQVFVREKRQAPTITFEEGVAQKKDDSQELRQTVTRMDGKSASFQIPHTILASGTSRSVPLDGNILSIAKYVSTDITAYASIDVAMCDGATCGALTRSMPLNRSQALFVIDVQLTNKNRVGSVALDPAKQFRVLVGSDFYVPVALTSDAENFVEVPELGSRSTTFVVRVPKDVETFRLIFGENIQNPTGLFDVNLMNQTIEAIGG